LDKENKKKDKEKIFKLIEFAENQNVEIPELPTSQKFKSKGYANFFPIEFFILLIRAFLSQLKNRLFLFARVFQTLLMSFIVGFLYLQMGYFQSNIQDRKGALFFITVNQGLSIFNSSNG
jgi:hypothetical protein